MEAEQQSSASPVKVAEHGARGLIQKVQKVSWAEAAASPAYLRRQVPCSFTEVTCMTPAMALAGAGLEGAFW